MEPDRASWTARAAASCRAHHYAHDSPRIFEDSLAASLITPEEREAIKSGAPSGERRRGGSILGRARYNEDKLADAIRKGISQYVIVGAGLDTFALRRRDLQDRLRVFELDHPQTQTLKRERVGQAALALPPHLHFCPTDFERDSVASSLSRSAYDPTVPTFFSWLGVTYYLTREAIGRTLGSIRSVAAPGSELVMDYLDSAVFLPESQSPDMRALFDWVRRVGEPFLTGFDPRTFAEELAVLGFDLAEDLDPTEQHARYFLGRADGLRPFQFNHFVHARR